MATEETKDSSFIGFGRRIVEVHVASTWIHPEFLWLVSDAVHLERFRFRPVYPYSRLRTAASAKVADVVGTPSFLLRSSQAPQGAVGANVDAVASECARRVAGFLQVIDRDLFVAFGVGAKYERRASLIGDFGGNAGSVGTPKTVPIGRTKTEGRNEPNPMQTQNRVIT